MKTAMLMLFSIPGVSLGVAQRLNVAICNLSGLRDSVVLTSQAETGAAFRAAGVSVMWRDCNVFPAPEAQEDEPWFVIRLRAGKPPRAAGASSLQTMGKVLTGERGEGSIADAYWETIRDFADRYHGDAGMLQGLVIAHELGHLILGPGHAPRGIMQAAWGQKEMNALSQRWLRFDQKASEQIRRELRARVTKHHRLSGDRRP
jgi:hypothetical protein